MLSSDGAAVGFNGVALGRSQVYGTVAEAVCVQSARHRCPSTWCDCGFYCFHEAEQARALACDEQYERSVLLEVLASGRYVSYELGLRYQRQTLTFERGAVEGYGQPDSFDVVVFLQTIEHVQDPKGVLEHFQRILAPGGVAYESTPNLLTLAPPGAEKSDNPWHIREYRAAEFGELCRSVFESVEVLGLFHARKLRVHEVALRLGWDQVHHALRITKPFYDWFTPAISARDFELRPSGLDGALDFLAVCR